MPQAALVDTVKVALVAKVVKRDSTSMYDPPGKRWGSRRLHLLPRPMALHHLLMGTPMQRNLMRLIPHLAMEPIPQTVLLQLFRPSTAHLKCSSRANRCGQTPAIARMSMILSIVSLARWGKVIARIF